MIKTLIVALISIFAIAVAYAQTFNVVGCATISESTITFIACPPPSSCTGTINFTTSCVQPMLGGL